MISLVFVILHLLLAAVVPNTVVAEPAPVPCTVPRELAHTRPDPRDVPTPVTLSLEVRDIKTVNAAQEDFTVDFVLWLRWTDQRLVAPGGGRSLAGCRPKLTEVWHPEVQIFNETNLATRFAEVVTVSPEGLVTYRQRFIGLLSSPMELHEFPFDTQVLPITVASIAYSPEEIELVFDAAATMTGKWVAPAGWSIEAMSGRVSVLEVERTGVQNRFARFDYEIQVRRHIVYHLWKEIGPLILIVCMSWAVFWIDPAQLGAQIGVASTSMLTLIAFLFALGRVLPPVPYLTRMDHFIFGSVLLVFLAFVEAITTCTLAARGQLALAQQCDRWARRVFPLIFVGLLVVTFGL